MRTQPRPDRLARLDEITLSSGNHGFRSGGMCAMEAVAWLAGERHSDHPRCASVFAIALLQSLNDSWSDRDRQRLKKVLPRLIGTADGRDFERALVLVDFLSQELIRQSGLEEAPLRAYRVSREVLVAPRFLKRFRRPKLRVVFDERPVARKALPGLESPLKTRQDCQQRLDDIDWLLENIAGRLSGQRAVELAKRILESMLSGGDRLRLKGDTLPEIIENKILSLFKPVWQRQSELIFLLRDESLRSLAETSSVRDFHQLLLGGIARMCDLPDDAPVAAKKAAVKAYETRPQTGSLSALAARETILKAAREVSAEATGEAAPVAPTTELATQLAAEAEARRTAEEQAAGLAAEVDRLSERLAEVSHEVAGEAQARGERPATPVA